MAKKDLDNIVNDIPALDHLAGRFLFIKDEVLRENVTIAFQYIIFLISIESEITWQGSIIYSIFKDVMVYTGSVVESCLHYCVKEYFKANKLNRADVMTYEWKIDKHISIYKIDETKEVCSLIRHKKMEDFCDQTQFKDINNIAKKAGILTDDLFKKAEKIREDRNKVHLVALGKTHDYFTKDNVEASFKSAKEIIERIESKLLEKQEE